MVLQLTICAEVMPHWRIMVKWVPAPVLLRLNTKQTEPFTRHQKSRTVKRKSTPQTHLSLWKIWCRAHLTNLTEPVMQDITASKSTLVKLVQQAATKMLGSAVFQVTTQRLSGLVTTRHAKCLVCTEAPIRSASGQVLWTDFIRTKNRQILTFRKPLNCEEYPVETYLPRQRKSVIIR